MHFLIRHRRVDAQANPTWFVRQIALTDLRSDQIGGLLLDFEQIMPIRSRARATAAHLDAEIIVEHFNAQVIMQISDIKRHNAQSFGVLLRKNVQILNVFEFVKNDAEQFFFPFQIIASCTAAEK